MHTSGLPARRRCHRVARGCRSRAVNEDALRDGATIDLVRRQPFDHDHRPATPRTRRQREWRGRPRIGCGERLTWMGLKRSLTEWKVAGAASVRKKPKEADPDETLGQDVQEESTEQFDGTDRHRRCWLPCR
jgi:hypothetical protein